MPPKEAFHTASGWTGTILHELGHWSGSSARLDRNLRCAFGSHDHAREEVRVELGQIMVHAELGLAEPGASSGDFTNNAAYVASWLKTLRSDRKEVFRAAADAQRIADYLLAFHPGWASRGGPSAAEAEAGAGGIPRAEAA